MSLSGIKALRASEITLGKTDFIWFSKTLDIIHDTMLLKLMGQNSMIYYGSFFLGIGTIFVKFIFLKYLPKCRTDNTTKVTSSPIICQYFRKKKKTVSGPYHQ